MIGKKYLRIRETEFIVANAESSSKQSWPRQKSAKT